MEPISLVLLGLGVVLTGALVVVWDKIIEWAQDALFPWLDVIAPWLGQLARTALVAVNRVVGAVRKAAIEGWRELRRYLLKVTEQFERTASGRYLVRIISWLRRSLEEQTVQKRTEEQTVAFDDLPADVQDAFLHGRSSEVDVSATQDGQTGRPELAW